MAEPDVASTLGAHRALSNPTARIWRRVALGELSSKEAAAFLLREREGIGDLDHETIERGGALFEPPTPERHRENLRVLLQALRAPDELVRETGAAPNRSWRWVPALAAATSVVFLLWLLWLRPPVSGPSDGGPTFLAEYALAPGQGAAPMRGRSSPSSSEVRTFVLGGKVKLLLLPARAVEGAVDAVVYALGSSGTGRRLPVELIVHPAGAVELDATARALGLDEGEWTLLFVIGPPSTLPRSWNDVSDDRGSGSYEVVRVPVKLVARL
ncbi:MAG: hypothetical protein AAGF11_39865 [Myxococcota bacterium]